MFGRFKGKYLELYLNNFKKYFIVVCDFLDIFDSTYGFITIPQNKMLKKRKRKKFKPGHCHNIFKTL